MIDDLCQSFNVSLCEELVPGKSSFLVLSVAKAHIRRPDMMGPGQSRRPRIRISSVRDSAVGQQKGCISQACRISSVRDFAVGQKQCVFLRLAESAVSEILLWGIKRVYFSGLQNQQCQRFCCWAETLCISQACRISSVRNSAVGHKKGVFLKTCRISSVRDSAVGHKKGVFLRLAESAVSDILLWGRKRAYFSDLQIL